VKGRDLLSWGIIDIMGAQKKNHRPLTTNLERGVLRRLRRNSLAGISGGPPPVGKKGTNGGVAPFFRTSFLGDTKEGGPYFS